MSGRTRTPHRSASANAWRSQCIYPQVLHSSSSSTSSSLRRHAETTRCTRQMPVPLLPSDLHSQTRCRAPCQGYTHEAEAIPMRLLWQAILQQGEHHAPCQVLQSGADVPCIAYRHRHTQVGPGARLVALFDGPLGGLAGDGGCWSSPAAVRAARAPADFLDSAVATIPGISGAHHAGHVRLLFLRLDAVDGLVLRRQPGRHAVLGPGALPPGASNTLGQVRRRRDRALPILRSSARRRAVSARGRHEQLLGFFVQVVG